MKLNNDGGITEDLINDILESVCLILNIVTPVESENATEEQEAKYKEEKADYDVKIKLLTLYIEMICNNILIKTNRRIFSKELKYVVINLVKDKFDENTPDTDIQTIQSMSEAGRSVNFGVSSILQSKLALIAQKQVEENEILINRFRLLYKT